MSKKSLECKRSPLDGESRVFVWYDPDNNCIEIQHGNTGTIIAFEERVDVFIVPLTTEHYDFDEKEYIYDCDGRAVAIWVENIEDTGLDLFVVRYHQQEIYFEVPCGTAFRVGHEWF